MIHIIVATDFEAKPLIQSFDLKKYFPQSPLIFLAMVISH